MYFPEGPKGAGQTECMTSVLGLKQAVPTRIRHVCDYLLIAGALPYDEALYFFQQGRHGVKAWGC